MKHIFMLFFVLACSNFVFAEPAEIEFTAIVKSSQKESDKVGALTMVLTPNFDVLVRVTGLTEIRDEKGKPMVFSQIKVGMTLEVEGLLTQNGVLAQEVKVADKATDFELNGRIENIDLTNREIKVHGFVIRVPVTAEINDEEGNPLLFADLKLNQFVEVEGSISGSTLVASEVKVKTPEGKAPRISFEGIVVAQDDSKIRVLIEGVDAAVVKITPETDIHGDLAVGVLVRVVGIIDTDLSVKAHKIIVKNILQVAPHELKMSPHKTRRVEVILRCTLETDAKLSIASQNPSVAKPSVSSLTIPKGKVTGFFDVTSGPTEGKTTIEIQLAAELGGHKVILPVEVEDAHDEEKKKELEIEWRPEEVHMQPNQTKKVQLRLNRPALTALVATVTVKEGASGLVEFPPQVSFAAGSQNAEVTIKSGSANGKTKIRATLPASVGGDKADLEIEIRSEQQQQELEIKWAPDEIKIGLNESRTVKLLLGAPAPHDLTAVLTLKERKPDLVEFPHQVSFAKGSLEANVVIKSKNSTGKVKIRAALPFSVGGDSEDLEVEIG